MNKWIGGRVDSKVYFEYTTQKAALQDAKKFSLEENKAWFVAQVTDMFETTVSPVHKKIY